MESEIFNSLSCRKSLSEYTKLNQTLSGVFPPDKWEREIEDYFTSDEDIRKIKVSFEKNLFALLVTSPNNESAISRLFDFFVQLIETDPSNVFNKYDGVYDALNYFLDSDMIFLNGKIGKFINEIPTLVQESTYQNFAGIMAQYSNSKFFKMNTDAITSLENFFIVALSFNLPKTIILATMNELDNDIYQQLMKSDSLELELYIEELYEKL